MALTKSKKPPVAAAEPKAEPKVEVRDNFNDQQLSMFANQIAAGNDVFNIQGETFPDDGGPQAKKIHELAKAYTEKKVASNPLSGTPTSVEDLRADLVKASGTDRVNKLGVSVLIEILAALQGKK